MANDGGRQGERGNEWERHALLLYTLLRHAECPALEVEFQPDNGEDAIFRYPADTGRGGLRTVEYVQCKTRSTAGSEQVYGGSGPGEQVLDGFFHMADLRNAVTVRRKGLCVEDELNKDLRTTEKVFTLLIRGTAGPQLEEYVPAPILEFSRTRHYEPALFLQGFPFAFTHPSGRELPGVQRSEFIPLLRRLRLRVVPLLPSVQIKEKARTLLEDSLYYNVSPDVSHSLLNHLLGTVESRTIPDLQVNRTWTGPELDALVSTGRRRVSGSWQHMGVLLRRGEQRRYDPAREPFPFWSDYEDGRYIRTDEFASATEALRSNRPLVVLCGPSGTGKTVLARHMAYEFLRESPGRNAFYLSAHAGHTMQEELKFMDQEIDTDTLFIVDDQARAQEAVEHLVHQFLSQNPGGRKKAKLVVTSTRSYSGTQAWAHDRTQSELDFGSIIQVHDPDPEDFIRKLHQFFVDTAFSTPFTAGEIWSLSNGHIGSAMLYAQAAAHKDRRLTGVGPYSMADSLMIQLRGWILERLGRNGDRSYFEEEIVPVFILCAHGLAVPGDFSSAVSPLHSAGFLETEENRAPALREYRTPNSALATTIARQQFAAENAVLLRYLQDETAIRLPTLCACLSQSDSGRGALRRLCEGEDAPLVEMLRDHLRSLPDVDSRSILLQSLRVSSPPTAEWLLSEIAWPDGVDDTGFFRELLQSTDDFAKIGRFLQVAQRISRFRVRELTERSIQPELNRPDSAPGKVIQRLLALSGSNTLRLDELAASLHALRRCSRPVAQAVYARIKEGGIVTAKVNQLRSSPHRIDTHLRYCEHIRPLSRADCYSHLRTHLSQEILLEHFQREETNPLARSLYRVHRLHPGHAAELVRRLDEGRLVERQLRAEEDLPLLVNSMYALARIDRRTAVRVGNSILNHLSALCGAAPTCRQVGSALSVLRSSVSVRLAEAVAEQLDAAHTFTQVKTEGHPQYIGRFLATLTEVRPELAYEVRGKLDPSSVIVNWRRSTLRDLAFFLRGMIVSVNDEHARVADEFVNSPEWQARFAEAWEKTTFLGEAANCLVILAKTLPDREDIARLLGYRPFSRFEAELRERCRRGRSSNEVAALLYAVTRLSPEYAAELFGEYGDSEERRLTVNPRGSAGAQVPPLAGAAQLLRVGAALRPEAATKLASCYGGTRRFQDYARDEPSLGRLADYMGALHGTSRSLARSFVRDVADQQAWEDQFDDNEPIGAVIHYARELRRISLGLGERYSRWLFDEKEKDILAALTSGQNVQEVAKWLRLVPHESRYDVLREQLAQLTLITAASDSQLRGLLQAAGGLAASDAWDAAGQVANLAWEQRVQTRYIWNLEEFNEVCLRSLYLERVLDRDGFSSTLLEHLTPRNIREILQQDLLVASFAHHVATTDSALVSGVLRREAEGARGALLARARGENSPLRRVLALLFAHAGEEEIATAFSGLADQPLWEVGLAGLLGVSLGNLPAERVGSLLTCDEAALTNRTTAELNEHTHNLRFALAAAFLTLSGRWTLAEEFLSSRAERAEDEANPFVQALLRWGPEDPPLTVPTYSAWWTLQGTILSPLQLRLDEFVEQVADRGRHSWR